MTWVPVLVREADRGGRPVVRLGHRQSDRYLEFAAARARPNTVLATGYDLKVFFSLVPKEPVEVTTADVLEFITVQRGDRKVVRLADGESGLSARTIQRRLSSISGLFGVLLACGEVGANPVPRGLSNRKRSRIDRGTPLVSPPTGPAPTPADEQAVRDNLHHSHKRNLTGRAGSSGNPRPCDHSAASIYRSSRRTEPLIRLRWLPSEERVFSFTRGFGLAR